MDYELSDLLNDVRLERLFSINNHSCALQLWVLQIQHQDTIESRLIYGRLLPYSFSNNKWSFSDNDNSRSFSDFKASVIQLNLYLNSSSCSELLTMISEGKTLDEISTALNLTYQHRLQERFGDVSLLNITIGFRPVAYLMNRNAHVSGSLLSPLGNAGAFSASIFRGNKTELFVYDGLYNESLTSMIIEQLNLDTGMDFSNKDLRRIGDIELLVFPTIDEQENTLLTVNWTEEGDVEVEFIASQLPNFNSFNFILTLENYNQVIYSCNAIANNTENKFEYVFKLNNKLKNIVDSARVDIYGFVENDNKESYLCSSWENFYVREVGIQTTVMENSNPNIRFDWLQTTTRPDMDTRVKNVLSFSGMDYTSNSVVGGRKLDNWVPENRAIQSLFKILYPSKSNGGFFLRWGQSQGEGRLQFVEWLKNVLKTYENYHIAIFDPYFEDVGSALLTLYVSQKAQYTVFRSIPKPKDGKGNRGVHTLLENCEHNRERLSRSNVKIYGLKEGRLHDRYILIIGKDGLPVEGYHLSNSFQTVAQNYPLLITPIPIDILYELKKYTLDLIQEANESSNDGSISVLFDTESYSTDVIKSYDPLSILEDELAGDLFSIWFNEPLLKGLYGENLKEKLKSLELLESNSFHDLKVNDLFNFIDEIQKDSTNFQDLWELIGHVLANSSIRDADFHDIALSSDFLVLLSGFLSNAFHRQYEEEGEGTTVTDPTYFTDTIDNLIKKPVELYHFNTRPKNNNISWAEYYAVELLWRYKPDYILGMFEREIVILRENPNDNHTIRLSLLEQMVNSIYMSVEFRTISHKHKNLLVKSCIGLAKWFGWAAIENDLKSSINVTSELSGFSNEEKIRFIGWSLNRNAERLDSREYYENLITELYKLLPQKVSNEDVNILIESTKGYHQKLSWSEPWLFRDIIQPLLAEGRVSYDYICQFWMQEIIEQFENTDKKETIIFSPDREQITTQVCAYLWANSSQSYRDSSIEILNKILRKQGRVIQKPLAKSINYAKWNKALKVCLWISVLAKLFKFNLESLKIDVSNSLEKLIGDSNDLAMTRAFSEWPTNDKLLLYLKKLKG